MSKITESLGEDFIADFLEEKGIKFKRNYKITDLKNDDKLFREADFYLPEYGIFIEFLGEWNKPEGKKRYKKKIWVYHENKKPCIYLWPDNLGTLDWMFKRKLREVLLKYNKKIMLFKYELENYFGEYGLSIIIFGFLIYFFKNNSWRIIILIILILMLFFSIKKYIQRLLKIKKTKWGSRDQNP